MTAPTPPVAVSPLPSLYPCPHLPGKARLTVRGCEANRSFVAAVLAGTPIRANNRLMVLDKETGLGLKIVCRDCPGILEVNGMKSTESAAVRKALQAEARPSGKRGHPPKSSTLGSATVPVSPIPPVSASPPSPRPRFPGAAGGAPPEGGDTEKRGTGEPERRTKTGPVPDSPPLPVPDSPPAAAPPLPVAVPPPPPDPVLNIRRCKNHPDRPWHKNTGLCIECNQDRLKTSANSPTAKLPHEREKNRILLDFNGGREELLEWFRTYAADQFRSPEAQLMFMVKSLSEQGPELLLTTNH